MFGVRANNCLHTSKKSNRVAILLKFGNPLNIIHFISSNVSFHGFEGRQRTLRYWNEILLCRTQRPQLCYCSLRDVAGNKECTTGSPDEYATIEQTFSPAALNEITQWILKIVQ